MKTKHIFILGFAWLVINYPAFAATHSATSGFTRVDTRAKNPVVFLHGYHGDPSTWGNMTNLLMYDTNAFYPTNNMLVLDYSTETRPLKHTPINELAYDVGLQIRDFAQAHGKPVDVVAHSMGGLILRSARAQGYLLPSHIRRFIPIATPHYGQYLGVDEQSWQMMYGSEFLWDLAKAWHFDNKKIPDGDVLCIAGLERDSDDWYWDGLVHHWSAALGNTEVRYVGRSHSDVLSGIVFDDRPIWGCYGRDGKRATSAAIRDGTADDLKDAVYVLVRNFLMEGQKLPQSALGAEHDNNGLKQSVPISSGTIFLQVQDPSGNPVSYGLGGNIVSTINPWVGLEQWHAKNNNSQRKGIELLTKSGKDIGIPTGTYTLDMNFSAYNKYEVLVPPSVAVRAGRTTVLQIPATLSLIHFVKEAAIASALGAANQVVEVVSSVAWEAISTVPWLILHTLSGSGTAQLFYSVSPNETTSERSGDIVVTHYESSSSGIQSRGVSTYSITCTVTQAAASIGSIEPEGPSGMVRIPGGVNTGKDPSADIGYTLSSGTFWMDATEVTKAQWDAVYNWAVIHGYAFSNAGSGKGSTHPAHSVNWYDVVKWCNARSEKEGRPPAYRVNGNVYRTGQSIPVCDFRSGGYRLPTYSEWWYAARGGVSSTDFPWGNLISHDLANYVGIGDTWEVDKSIGNHPAYTTGALPYTSPVGSFAPNNYGLFDMVGNVWEWLWDEKSDSYRAIDGASWGVPSILYVWGIKVSELPAEASNEIGFRTVLQEEERPEITSMDLSSGPYMSLGWTTMTNPVRILHRASMVTGDWEEVTGWFTGDEVRLPPNTNSTGFYVIEVEP